tara:strand:- start:2632 stop:3543 length:912 start_codon:yes stop_codon:yes gene_type:complete
MNSHSVSGWIYLDKPIGISSNQALQKTRKIFGNCKAGYVGTLDPLASGFLPIALGRSTKTIQYLQNHEKEYVFEVKWGVKTLTGDLEGKIEASIKKIPHKSDISKVLKKFFPDYFQTPHRFSAKKIKGIKAYQLARKKIDFELKQQKKKIHKLEILNSISSDRTRFYVKCESGTYIRSLVEDIAHSLATYGTVISLRRIGFGNLDKKLISLDYLLSLVHIEDLLDIVKPVNMVFNNFNQIFLEKKDVELILDGRPIKMKDFKNGDGFLEKQIALAKFENEFVAVGYLKDGNFYPKNLLNNLFV